MDCEDFEEDGFIKHEVIERGDDDSNSSFAAGTVVKVSCTVGYGVNLPNATVKCVHGNWKPAPPQCDTRKHSTFLSFVLLSLFSPTDDVRCVGFLGKLEVYRFL